MERYITIDGRNAAGERKCVSMHSELFRALTEYLDNDETKARQFVRDFIKSRIIADSWWVQLFIINLIKSPAEPGKD